MTEDAVQPAGPAVTGRKRHCLVKAFGEDPTGVSRPEAVRSCLSTAGPKPNDTGCERVAKAIHTEDNSPLG